MRVVLDTNVFISGIFWKGNFCSKIIEKWVAGKFQLVSSVDLLDEFMRTMKNFKIQIPEDMIVEWRELIIENSIMVQPDIMLKVIKEDPDDNKFLEAAMSGKADYIISQDKHLLKLKVYRQIRIINPKTANLIL